MKIGINIWMLLGAWPRLDKSICSQVFEVLNDPFHFEFRLPSLERFSQMAHLFLSESLTCGCGSICCYPKTNGWKTYLTTHIDMYSETKKKKSIFSFIFGELHGPLTSFDLFLSVNHGEFRWRFPDLERGKGCKNHWNPPVDPPWGPRSQRAVGDAWWISLVRCGCSGDK